MEQITQLDMDKVIINDKAYDSLPSEIAIIAKINEIIDRLNDITNSR